MFRNLRADEVEVRVSNNPTKSKRGNYYITLLLYKDARCDMNILDETVGQMNWKREHTRDNANCIVSIWDTDKSMWISKEDTGTESFTEKEKGLASDSFKRACFNWGIGRELYTRMFLYVELQDSEVYLDANKNVKISKSLKFSVSQIDTLNGEILNCVIVDNKGEVRVRHTTKDVKKIEEFQKMKESE